MLLRLALAKAQDSGATPLFLAAYKGQAGGADGSTALSLVHSLALHRQVALVQSLLDAGADKDRPEHQGLPEAAKVLACSAVLHVCQCYVAT